ncbi:MAG: type II toxin-antitoxin system Phd/YefM family antitoxin [Pseudonocardiaceae bacterium]
MTASEASRNFSAVLSATERGETIAVTRSGRRVAHVTPAPRASGQALREVFETYHNSPIVDDAFTDRVERALATLDIDEDNDPWTD